MSIPLDLSNREQAAVDAVAEAIRESGSLHKDKARVLVKETVGKMGQNTFS